MRASMLILAAFLFIVLAFVPPSFAAIQIDDTGATLRISNGALILDITKNNGKIVSLRRVGGPKVLGPNRPIYFDANGHGSLHPRKDYWGFSDAVYRLVRRTPHMLEISFEQDGGDYFPFLIRLHYILFENDPGIYCYVTYRHDVKGPIGTIGQTRMVIKCKEDYFTHYYVNRQEQGEYPPFLKPGQHLVKVTDATYRFPNGRIATKYNLADFEDHQHFHGLMGPDAGVWIINASNEYVNGGPTKQELMVHEDDPIILEMFHGGHFLDYHDMDTNVSGKWEKCYGPYLIYLNSGPTPQAMIADAQRRAEQEEREWPYKWMESPLYPIRRGWLKGSLDITDGSSPANATVILAAPTPDWQLQWRGYIFWSHAKRNGSFEIPAVRSGKYTLYVFASGVVGEYRKDNVIIREGEITSVGKLNWTPPMHGVRLWQVGIPNRSAEEFRYGNLPRQFGLWNRYPTDFPHDVHFVIGKSSDRKDWNYCEPVVQRSDGSYHAPTWHVLFQLPHAETGTAYLTIGISGAVHNPDLLVSANGVKVAQYHLGNDASVYRDANKAGEYRLKLAMFHASLLKKGENDISLKIVAELPRPSAYNPQALPRQAIMYDFLRLEIGR